jgi:hypothetical protein
MSFALPVGSVLQGTSNEGNSVTWQLPGHTVQKPRLAIFKRVIPAYNQQTQKWSDARYSYKVVYGILDADGAPVRPNISIGTEGITLPLSGVDLTTTTETAWTLFQTLTAGITASEVISQALPTCCPTAE